MQRPGILRGQYRIYVLVGVTFVVSFILFELATYGSLILDDYHHPPVIKGSPTPTPLTTVRGLSPEQRERWEASGLKCAGSGVQLTLARINDDYCDCADGTDEPGTSACANGRFWCAGEQHHMPSSMVDDGICDCCDGSDEARRRCPNTCASYHPPAPDDDGGDNLDGAHKSKPHESIGYSFLVICLWLFILCHLFAILGGLWYLASPARRDHAL